jgi:phosphoribosylaminoimidazole (AIR) synthetase
VRDFVAAWDKVMNLDRYDLAGSSVGRSDVGGVLTGQPVSGPIDQVCCRLPRDQV